MLVRCHGLFFYYKNRQYIKVKGIKKHTPSDLLLFANTDVPTTKMCLDTSILAKSNINRYRRE
jgi:hypothetical protein